MRLLLISTFIFIVCICGCIEEDHSIRIADVSLTLDDFSSSWEPYNDLLTYNQNTCEFEEKPYVIQEDNFADLSIQNGEFIFTYSINRFENETRAQDYYQRASNSRAISAKTDYSGEISEYGEINQGYVGFAYINVNTNYWEDSIDTEIMFIDRNICVNCNCHSNEYNTKSELDYAFEMTKSSADLIEQRLEENKPEIYLFY